MIQLFDKESGKALGAITDAQLQFLIAQLEEESLKDQDYYINRDTLDRFEGSGAETGLLALLRAAMGDREEMEIRWSRT
jgi:processive 1,2-diacylglycerol beta-glucosyltransferase